MNAKTLRILEYISIACAVIGILTWIPNFVMSYGYGYSLATIPLGIIGFILALIAKKKVLAVINFLVATSIYWLLWIGYAFISKP